jgi:hypothetical protein
MTQHLYHGAMDLKLNFEAVGVVLVLVLVFLLMLTIVRVRVVVAVVLCLRAQTRPLLLLLPAIPVKILYILHHHPYHIQYVSKGLFSPHFANFFNLI